MNGFYPVDCRRLKHIHCSDNPSLAQAEFEDKDNKQRIRSPAM